MNTDKIRKKIEMYVPISDETMDEIESQLEEMHLKKQETLVHYGDANRNLFFVMSGSFEISFVLSDGSKKTIWFFMDDLFDVATCPDTLIMEVPTTYEITALENSKVLKIGYQTIQDIFDRNLHLYKYKAEAIANDLMVMNEIRSRVAVLKPIEVMEYLEQNFPMLIKRIPAKNIASLMGITPEWYSKLRKKANLN